MIRSFQYHNFRHRLRRSDTETHPERRVGTHGSGLPQRWRVWNDENRTHPGQAGEDHMDQSEESLELLSGSGSRLQMRLMCVDNAKNMFTFEETRSLFDLPAKPNKSKKDRNTKNSTGSLLITCTLCKKIELKDSPDWVHTVGRRIAIPTWDRKIYTNCVWESPERR